MFLFFLDKCYFFFLYSSLWPIISEIFLSCMFDFKCIMFIFNAHLNEYQCLLAIIFHLIIKYGSYIAERIIKLFCRDSRRSRSFQKQRII